MELVFYVTCKITFQSADRPAPNQGYSDRTLVELRQNEYGNHFLRALDMKNNKTEIFNFQLENRDAFKFAASSDLPDEVRCNKGTYFLHLKDDARGQFQAALNTYFQQRKSAEQGPSTVNPKPSSKSQLSSGPQDSKTIEEGNEILIDIHKLSVCMQKGKEKDAADLAKKLAEKRVRLQFEESEELSNETRFPIEVQIDCIDSKIKDTGKKYRVNVYPSTKVRELRAIFEDLCDFPSTNQYFFVNGHLAYPESTMDYLEVEKNSLFVLFATDQYSEKRTPL